MVETTIVEEDKKDVTLGMIPDLTGKRLLLVEDMEINRVILIQLLADTHVEIDEAVDGRAAVTAFEEKPLNYYDLIFMDIQMPLLDGYEATRCIRKLDRPDACTVPIIAITANVHKKDIERALDSGMNGHLGKPIDIDAVMLVLAEKIL